MILTRRVRGLCLGVLLVVLPMLAVGGCATPNDVLRSSGMQDLRESRVDDADRRFSQAVKQDATDWRAQYGLALVRLRQGRGLDAQVLVEQALGMHNQGEMVEDILDAQAEALFQQGRFEDMNAALKRAAARYGTPRDFVRQSYFLSKAGDVDGAKLALRKAVRISERGQVGPFLKMADFFEAVGDRESALLALRQAYAVAPDNVVVQNRLRKMHVEPGPTVGIEPEK